MTPRLLPRGGMKLLMARTHGGFGYYFEDVEGYFRVIRINMLKENRKVDHLVAFSTFHWLCLISFSSNFLYKSILRKPD